MKKLDLGQAITILANVAVISGIVFLAFELRQNKLMQAEAISTVLESRTVRHDQLIGNPALVEAATNNGRPNCREC